MKARNLLALPALATMLLIGTAPVSAETPAPGAIASAVAAASEVPAARPASATEPDAKYKALFLLWRAQDGPGTSLLGIPAGQPTPTFTLTSGFGVRADPFQGRAAFHPGIDLAGPAGTPIYATADGIVARSEWNRGGYGNLIEINHGAGLQTRYGHLSKRIAQPGQRIRRGDLIGLMGSTGRSTGSHLHYEVRIDGRPVNPMAFLPLPKAQFAKYASTKQIAEGGPEPSAR